MSHFKAKFSNVGLFITILMICILSGAEIDLFLPSFTELQRVFHLSPFLVQFTLTVNFFAYLLGTLLFGTLGDRYNRRLVILICLWIFIFASITCCNAKNYSFLLLGRFFQGISMSGPSVLVFAIIADKFSPHDQIAKLGILNAATTIAIAFAPVMGSYISIYSGWKGNFATLALMSLICLILGQLFIPDHKGNSSIYISVKNYFVMLRSPKLRAFVLAISFLITPYWLFLGMSPILYMHDLGMPLSKFGYFQGAMAAVFTIMNLFSSRVLGIFGTKRCIQLSAYLCTISMLLVIMLAILNIKNPFIITGCMLIFSAGIVFPINIMFPLCMEITENSRSRASAITMAARLIWTSLSIAFVSYFYGGHFWLIGVTIALFILFSLYFIHKIFTNDWLILQSQNSITNNLVKA